MNTCLHTALNDLVLQEKDAVVSTLAAHWALVRSWNQRTNLTAITNDNEAAWVHYRDSLAALPHLPGGSLVDFGSGAGFPGIPLAVAEPHRQVTLVEPRRKRASFLRTAVVRLGLPNVRVLEARAENEPDKDYAVAVTRATFSGDCGLTECLRWLSPGGTLIAFRSQSAPVLEGASSVDYLLDTVPRRLDIVTVST